MDKRRVVITGIGAITPIGHSAAESWRAVRDGVCGVASIAAFDVTDQKVTLAAEVKDYQPEDFLDKKEAKHMWSPSRESSRGFTRRVCWPRSS